MAQLVTSKIPIILPVLACWSCMVCAQLPETVTAEELNLQKLFIEANRAKLLGQNEEAEALYKEVINQDPRNHAAAYELSRVYVSVERYDDASDAIRTAVRLDPGNSWYLVMQADIYEIQENYAQAIAVYKKLTKSNPQENYFYEHLVDLQMKVNRPDEAFETLDAYEEQVGILPFIIDYKIKILTEQGNYEQATREALKLAELYPENIDYLLTVADMYEQSGNPAAANDCYKKILELDPTQPKANIALAGELKEQGAAAEYLTTIARLMQNPEIAIDAKIAELIPYMDDYAATGDTALGIALGDILQQLVESHADDAKSYALYGDFLYQDKRLMDAVRMYDKALAIDKGVFAVWEKALYTRAELADMDGVIRTAGNAMNYFPNQATVYYMSGMGFAYKEDYDQAEADLQQALVMSGRDSGLQVKILGLLGSVYAANGDSDRSATAYEKAHTLNPDDSELAMRYAESLVAARRDIDKASDIANALYRKDADNARVNHILALVEYERGEFAAARAYIIAALENGADQNYKALELYGDILFSLNETEQAVEYWQKSLDAGNNSRTLKRKISERKLIR